MQGTFSSTTKHCFRSTQYLPVYQNNVELALGSYTQTVDCAQSQLPNGYLVMQTNDGYQTIYDYTATGLNTNGIFFMPSTNPNYAQLLQTMQTYNSGVATRLTEWEYGYFS